MQILFSNVPHIKLVQFKGHQNWVQAGSYLTFPGGGSQFKHGAMNDIDFIQKICCSHQGLEVVGDEYNSCYFIRYPIVYISTWFIWNIS